MCVVLGPRLDQPEERKKYEEPSVYPHLATSSEGKGRRARAAGTREKINFNLTQKCFCFVVFHLFECNHQDVKEAIF